MSGKTKCKYMHTKNGRPARFYDEGIWIVHGTFKMSYLVDSLEEVRRHQSIANARDYQAIVSVSYGYIRVRVDQ